MAPWVPRDSGGDGAGVAPLLVLKPARPLGRPGLLPGPELPNFTQDNLRLLRSVLGCVNRMHTLVDEAQLFAALGIGATGDILVVEESPSSLALRACVFLLFHLSGLLADDRSSSATTVYYKWALDYIDQSVGQLCPSQSLVSALLLCAFVTQKAKQDVPAAASFTTLAMSISGMLPDICPEIHLAAACYQRQVEVAFRSGSVVWPPSSAPIGELSWRAK